MGWLLDLRKKYSEIIVIFLSKDEERDQRLRI
jgi:hypothetical protein